MVTAAAFPGCFGLRRLHNPCGWLQTVRCSRSLPCPSPPLPPSSAGVAVEETTSASHSAAGSITAEDVATASEHFATATVRSSSIFPKKGQTLELVCESLAFKGKGVCKVADTGFIVMCDRALPGERFTGRVSRKKGNYAEVQKLETLSPHFDIVDAPCKHAPDCGGCKTQNLLYEAQVRAKEQQVHELLIHVGKFSNKDPEFATVLRPIVPCNMHYHYRNKVVHVILNY